MEILRGLHGLDDVAAFPAWAYRIVTRRCQRVFHKTKREPDQYEEAEHDNAVLTPDYQSGEFAAELSIVMEAIELLPAEQRTGLALFYLEGFSVAEIAIALDVPPGTVKTRLMHARRKVRQQLLGANYGQDRPTHYESTD